MGFFSGIAGRGAKEDEPDVAGSAGGEDRPPEPAQADDPWVQAHELPTTAPVDPVTDPADAPEPSAPEPNGGAEDDPGARLHEFAEMWADESTEAELDEEVAWGTPRGPETPVQTIPGEPEGVEADPGEEDWDEVDGDDGWWPGAPAEGTTAEGDPAEGDPSEPHAETEPLYPEAEPQAAFRRWPAPGETWQPEGPPEPVSSEVPADVPDDPGGDDDPPPIAEQTASETTAPPGPVAHPLWPAPPGYRPSAVADVASEPGTGGSTPSTDDEAEHEPSEPASVGVVTAIVLEAPAAASLDRARQAFERRGGTIRPEGAEALVALFGPGPPDGDATLRAVRATLEAREAAELAVPEDGDVEVRVGVGSCEVMDGDADDLERDTGRAVDLALRLQRMAGPSEVIVGEGVFRLLGDAASVEPVDHSAALDPSGPVGPLRLLGVAPEDIGPLLRAAPLVGRRQELSALRDAFDLAVEEAKGVLALVEGEAGVGTTSLVEELLEPRERDGDALVLRVRCPAGADGAARPVADLVEVAAGIDARRTPDEARTAVRAVLGDAEDATAVAERLAHAIGDPEARGVPEETAWALRRLLTSLARERPVIVWFDAFDRANAGFVRFLHSIVRRIDGAAVLVVGSGSPRPDRPVPADAIEIGLEPLPDDDVRTLVTRLLGDPGLGDEDLAVVAGAARGNPFVVEQLLAFFLETGRIRWEHGRPLLEAGPGGASMPTSLPELLQARLRDLPSDRRTIAAVAAALGERFDPALMPGVLASEELATAAPDHLGSLVHAHLLRREPAVGGRELLAFRSASIREAAAGAIFPDARSDVHRRVAAVLAEESGDRPLRVAEAIGTHLEAALDGGPQPEDPTIATHAAGHLAAAGARAEQAGDDAAAAALFGRAAALLPVEDAKRIDLLLARGRAFARLGEHRRAQDAFVDASRTARAADDRDGELRTKVLLASLRVRAGVNLDVLEEVRETADRAIETFGELGDELGLAWGWGLRALVHRSRGHATAQADAARRAADHAVGAGDAGEEASALRTVAEAIAAGPGLLSEAIEDCRAVAARARGHRAAVLDVTATLAVLHARRGELEEARRLARGASAAARDLGLERETIAAAFREGLVEAVAGDPATAETLLRDALAAAEHPDAEAPRAAIAATLARVLLDLGRPTEVLELAELAGRAAPRDDWGSQVACRAAWARASAELGHVAEGLATAREAVRIAEQTDSTILRAEALLDLARVLELAGRPNEAAPIARRALRGLSRTGATAPAARARTLLERLSATPAAEPGAADPGAADPGTAEPDAAEPDADPDGST